MQSTVSIRRRRGLQGQVKAGRKPRTKFEDAAEEEKYKSYLKHVKALNKMKEYLGSMHRTMSKDVIKRLVVSIKKMEEDLNFYENNWHLFKSPQLDYTQGWMDVESGEGQADVEDVGGVATGSGTITLNYPEIISEGRPYTNFSGSRDRRKVKGFFNED